MANLLKCFLVACLLKFMVKAKPALEKKGNEEHDDLAKRFLGKRRSLILQVGLFLTYWYRGRRVVQTVNVLVAKLTQDLKMEITLDVLL